MHVIFKGRAKKPNIRKKDISTDFISKGRKIRKEDLQNKFQFAKEKEKHSIFQRIIYYSV